MAYGLKALFFKAENDKKPLYEVEINGIVQPENLVNEFGFKQIYLNEGYVDFLLEVTEDDLAKILNYYGENLFGHMVKRNQELMHTVLEGDDCERICLWIYEWNGLVGPELSFTPGEPLGMEIYSDEMECSKRFINVYIERDTVKIVQQDLGPLVKKCFGDYDYEREMTIPLKDLKSVLNVSNNLELLLEIKKKFGNKDAIDEMGEFCEKNNIVKKYFSY